jgi:hypothetical protein
LVTAIGHANDHTLLDDIADFSLAVPSMVGKWLAEQLEMKARRQADSKRLSGLKLEEELKKLQGELVVIGKARVEEQKALLQLQTDWGALERPAPCSALGSHAAAKRVLITREAAICSSDWYQPIRRQFPTKSICGNSLVGRISHQFLHAPTVNQGNLATGSLDPLYYLVGPRRRSAENIRAEPPVLYLRARPHPLEGKVQC